MKPYVVTTIDGKNLNARWFASFEQVEAVERLKQDGIAPNDEWAIRAYHQMVEDVENFDHEAWLTKQVDNNKIHLSK